MSMHTMLENAGELFWFRGALINIRVSWDAGEDRVSVVEHYMPCGMSPPLHVHRNEDEVLHILEGSLRIQVDGVESVAHAGQTVMAPKGVPHSFRVESPEGARCLTITSGGDLERMIRENGRPADSISLPPEPEPRSPISSELAKSCARNGIDIVGAPLS